MNEILPTARDTIPPEPGEDFRHGSTLPPFASEARVADLEDKHNEVMATLGEIRSAVATLTNRVMEFHDDIRRNSARLNRLAARLSLVDEDEEGASNGRDAKD